MTPSADFAPSSGDVDVDTMDMYNHDSGNDLSNFADDQSRVESNLDEGSNHMRNEDQIFKIGRSETKNVWRLKLVVALVLLIATIGVSLAVYYYVSSSERQQFETQFAEYADKVFEAIGLTLDQTLGSLDSMMVGIASHVRATNQSWPNVMISDFAIRAAKTRSLSNVPIITLLPLVTNETRLEWEAFTAAKGRTWVDNAMTVQETDKDYYGPTLWEYDVHDMVWGNFGDIGYNETRDMLPTGQIYPMVTRYYPYNWDWLSILFPEGLYLCLDTRSIVISAAWMLPDPNDPVQVEEMEIWADWYSDYIHPDLDPSEPISDIMVPIFDSNSSVRVETENHEPVGILMGNIYWRDVIRDMLPPGADGVVVVVENPCNPSFTYMINGPLTEYLGRGDLHEPQYDHLRVSSRMSSLGAFRIRDSTYSGPPVDDTFCPFTFHVYPSSVLEGQYTTNNPVLFTIVAICIFVFTSLVFLAYDWQVERRQQVVLKKATQSTAVVASLFPEEVRDAVYETTGEEKAPPASKDKHQMLAANAPKEQAIESCMDNDSSRAYSGPPIAELYPETTVLFADLVGFTKWSSTRSPTEVFHLLESIYAEFDVIAKGRGVFKVETIGDSYVAVCGLPRPRRTHATVMVRFAVSIRDKMRQTTQKLEESLGPGTAELALRIGLNSGPTTAGVLRGEKSRFQLFGDTVNFASRMESNGQPNRIQVSQSTADQLKKSGKANWLTAREEMIEAKGKGLVQTFWAEPVARTVESCATSGASGEMHDDDPSC